jgi:hypothetical protein
VNIAAIKADGQWSSRFRRPFQNGGKLGTCLSRIFKNLLGRFIYAVVNRKELAAKQQEKSASTPAMEQEAISQANSSS